MPALADAVLGHKVQRSAGLAERVTRAGMGLGLRNWSAPIDQTEEWYPGHLLLLSKSDELKILSHQETARNGFF